MVHDKPILYTSGNSIPDLHSKQQQLLLLLANEIGRGKFKVMDAKVVHRCIGNNGRSLDMHSR
jgi:hypothetical protein